MQDLAKKIGIALAIFILISGIFVLYSAPKEKPTDISLSELSTQINESKIKEITVTQDKLDIKTTEDKMEKSTKEKEAGLTESLKNYGVDQEKLKNVNIIIKDDSSSSFWLGSILPFLLPFILISAFIWFMFRQAQKGNNQAMSFGSSRARMIDPKDKNKRTTFKDVAGAKESKEELSEMLGVGYKLIINAIKELNGYVTTIEDYTQNGTPKDKAFSFFNNDAIF